MVTVVIEDLTEVDLATVMNNSNGEDGNSGDRRPNRGRPGNSDENNRSGEDGISGDRRPNRGRPDNSDENNRSDEDGNRGKSRRPNNGRFRGRPDNSDENNSSGEDDERFFFVPTTFTKTLLNGSTKTCTR